MLNIPPVTDKAWLTAQRHAAGWTQVDAAEFLGVSLRQYKRYEAGHRFPRSIVIAMVCRDVIE